jgi:hypothetical protein
MKAKKYNRYLVPAIASTALAVSFIASAAPLDDAGGTITGDLTVEGDLTVSTPDPAAVSTGTAPTASIPIGNDKNTGFTNPGTPGLLNTYSTNGSGAQTQLVQTSGGVVINPNGNVTLTKERTQTETVKYTIESREIKVSDPAGFTDALGEYGIPGTFYPNGTTLPGTTEDVATVRDAAGNLLSVISDLPGVGPVTAVDGAGNPILDEAQVAAALVAGAPAGFFDPGTSVATPNTGNLSVEGQTTTNGIDNSGAKITNLADGTAPTDAATVGQVDAEEARAIAAEGVLDGKITTEKNDRIADVNAEEARATAAEGVLDGKITTEKNDRIADVNAEEARATAAEGVLDGKITAETTRATAAEGVLDGKITAETSRATAAEGVLDGKITQEVADRTALIRNVGGKIHIGQNSLVTSEAGGFQELSAQTVGGGSIDINVTNGSDLRVNGVSVATDTDVANEAAARTLADTLIRNDFAAADTAERNARIAADNSIRNEFQTADDDIRNEFQTADRNLRNDIDTNTRGIAMVAAMTNTTIRDGMTQGVDFNISQFEGETGFAFGYARKINENVQLHGAAASTTDFEESVGRLGVSFQW